jgi:ligand-binding sensor domain-containing protein/signal transduction histidine kinase
MLGWTRRIAHIRWRAAALLLLALAATMAAAAPPRSLRFEHVGVDQGLAQESVTTIVQDRSGYLWFGSQAGLSRFDGYKMTVFKNDPADRTSIADNYVLCGLEDEQGRLWFGGKGGLSRFDFASQKFINISVAAPNNQAAAANQVTAIASDGAGGLWLGTGDGLRHFDPASGALGTLRHDDEDPASLSHDRVLAFAREPDGTLWIGTANGLNRLAPGASTLRRYLAAAPGARPNAVLALALAPDRRLWIGTDTGLATLAPDAAAPLAQALGAAAPSGAPRILALYHDADANLWIGTEQDGLLRRDADSGRVTGYRHQPLDSRTLAENQVVSMLVDRSGSLWVGSWQAGAHRVDLASGGFERYLNAPEQPASISGNKVRAVLDDGAGRLWLGTTGTGLDLLDLASGSAVHWRHDGTRRDSLPDDIVTALARSGERLWVGMRSGLAYMDGASGRFTPVPLDGGDDAHYVQRMLRARDGALWVLTRGGLHRLGPGAAPARHWRNNPDDPASLASDYGLALAEDADGAIWVGTDNGLDRYDAARDRFVHFRSDPARRDGLRHNRVHALFRSTAGALWVGTAGGLYRVEAGTDGAPRFRHFPLSAARTADPIGALADDAAGRLWISTTAGLVRLDPTSGKTQAYTARDGLIDGSYFIGSGWRSPDGRISFGGVNGLTTFLPEVIRENPFAPPVAITDFLIFNTPLRAGRMLGGKPFTGAVQSASALTLPYSDSVFSFEFAALHFADPQRNRYAYQLEGFDQGWVDTDAGKRFATYTNLDPGHYVFRVRASNKDGVWSATPATLEVTITPPPWKTWWFRLALGGAALAAGYLLLRSRTRALVQQRTLLEQQVGARTADLLLEKDAALQQKEALELAQRNISLLSDIGRKLTANLDSEAIMQMLYAHVTQLMDASVFGIGVYQRERGVIDYPFAVERGSRYLPYTRSMAAPNQLAVWCIVNEREVFINDLDAEYANYIADLELTTGEHELVQLEDGSASIRPRSMIYVPIAVNGRMVGVVTVHSYERHAYNGLQLDMLRTLASYVGVAFDNADAYRQLKSTQVQQVAQEKLAALGSLVAGVAHELNTPIGNSLLMASTLQEKTAEMAAKFGDVNLRRSDLRGFIDAAQEATALILRSLHNAAELVNSFKQVAVDQSSAQRRRFSLEQATHEIVATMMNQVRKAGHTLVMNIPAGIEMDSYPGPYSQVILNLVNNALLHAFGHASGGIVTITASTPVAGRVLLVFHDNGVGIPHEDQARIFDPFFTTKLGQGGSGLGLNITYNIVTSLLEGTIRVESAAGDGTTFILDLPLAISA